MQEPFELPGCGQLLRVREFSHAAGIAESTTRRWMCEGKLRKVELSKRCVRIPASELHRLIACGFRMGGDR
jgi:predicted site-specific integrase-resolvase